MILSYKFRIKDKNARKRLERHARAVNYVWNYCCEIQRKAEDNWKAGRKSRWPSHFDLTNLLVGCGAELGIGSYCIGEVARVFCEARNANKRHPRFRASAGSRRALGWIPLRRVRVNGDSITWYNQTFRFWKSRDFPDNIKTAAIVQDARGRWYVTFVCDVQELASAGRGCVGIDLGLKTLAVCSDGTEVPALKHYRQYETALGVAQRAKNHRRVKAIYAKIANSRRHHLHEQSTRIVRKNNLIAVGNVNAAKLKRTTMAKSVSDAGWTMFRNMLRYKSSRAGAVFLEVDERFTSQVCSACGCISAASPKGLSGLGIRFWNCLECGISHDRDLNAAKNILRIGLERQPPLAEIAA